MPDLDRAECERLFRRVHDTRYAAEDYELIHGLAAALRQALAWGDEQAAWLAQFKTAIDKSLFFASEIPDTYKFKLTAEITAGDLRALDAALASPLRRKEAT